MIEINTFLSEQPRDVFEGAFPAVDLVEGRVVLEGRAGHDELGVGDFAIPLRVFVVAVVYYFLEIDLDGTRSEK